MSSWTDRKAVKTTLQLRDDFKVRSFIETGTYKGINARLYSKHFKEVFTCELEEEYFNIACRRLQKFDNVIIDKCKSDKFLKMFKDNQSMFHTPIIYLDAHFYNPKLPKKKRFVVLDELKALKGYKDCIIIIHDFANGLGHITYDGQPLNLDLIKKDLMKVNPNFKLYTNELSGCDIVKPTIKDIKEAGLEVDEDTIGNLEYAWSSPRLTYRGILYAVLKELDLTKYELVKYGTKP